MKHSNVLFPSDLYNRPEQRKRDYAADHAYANGVVQVLVAAVALAESQRSRGEMIDMLREWLVQAKLELDSILATRKERGEL